MERTCETGEISSCRFSQSWYWLRRGVLTAQGLQAQTPTTQSPATQSLEAMEAAGIKMAFDVASVKPNKSGDPRGHLNVPLGGDGWVPTGGLFSVTNLPLLIYIRFAYNLTAQSEPVGIPAWVRDERFDIEARSPSKNPTKDEMRLMMQSLLANRFKLAVHHETGQVPMYALVLAKEGKTGPQLQPHAEDGSCATAAATANKPPVPGATPPTSPSAPASKSGLQLPQIICGSVFGTPPTTPGRLRFVAKQVTMATVAKQVPDVDRPVVDRTRLSGTFDFSIEWSPAPSDAQPQDFTPDDTGPTFLEALQEQLGLKLESTKGPGDVIVIDHVEQPSEN